MWSSHSEELQGGRVLKFSIHQAGASIPYAEILEHWINDPAFRSFFVSLLANVPLPAFRWETPAITQSSARRLFEFVLLDSPELVTTPDPNAFAQHFKH